MKRMAIFVEGLTEQILVRRMLGEIMDRKQIAIQTVKATGGHNVRLSFTVVHAADVSRQTQYFVLIYDCGGETNVKGYMMSQMESLKRSGYTTILGLRDVYPNFSRQDIKKLRFGLNFKLPTDHVYSRIHLAVMETEAWFLAEYHHLQRVSPRLTPAYIQKKLGFNPKNDSMEDLETPAEDLREVYHLAGVDYTKKRQKLNEVVNLMDFEYFMNGLPRRLSSLALFVRDLENFFL